MKQDLLVTLRGLARQPSYAVVAVITLALGIGANVATFSTIYGVLLQPLPYAEPERLTALWARWVEEGVPRVSHTGGTSRVPARSPQLRRRCRHWLDSAEPDRRRPAGADQVGWISRNFFSVLGVAPMLGRDFKPDEGPGSVILDHDLWRLRFGGDSGVLGRTILLDGHPFTVVGVLPAGFKLHLSADAEISTDIDAWKPPDEAGTPVRWVTSELQLSTLRIIARLKPGVSLPQAQAEMDEIAKQLRARYPDHAAVGFHLDVEPLHQEVVGHVETALLALQGAVAFVLLIACMNVANLLLGRAQHRQREIALRLSLGSGTGRIVRHIVMESLVLAILGSGLGLLLAYWGIRLLVALKPARFPRLESIAINGPVLAFALGAMVLATLLAGLLPALRLRRSNLSSVLSDQSPRAGGGENRLSKLLIVAEVALSLVLLVGAGLLLRSFARLQEVRPGFETHNLLTFSINPPGVRYAGPAEVIALLKRLEDRLGSLSGVNAVSAVWPLPLEGQIWYGPYRSPDKPPQGDTPPLADYRVAAANYPPTIGARLLEGRLIQETDTNGILIDQRMAERNWPGRSALGRSLLASPAGSEMEFKVVGVIENIRHQDLKSEGRETIYLPSHRWARPDVEVCFVVRTAADPLTLVAPIRRELSSIDPQIPMAKVRRMDDYVADAVAPNRFALTLMMIFSIVAVVLAAVGLYGVVAYALGRRTREIGIRMALGAQRPRIFALGIREGMIPALVGIGLGILGSIGATRIIAGLLFEVSAADPLTYVGTAALLVLVVLLASYVPVWRAVRLNPAIAIHED